MSSFKEGKYAATPEQAEAMLNDPMCREAKLEQVKRLGKMVNDTMDWYMCGMYGVPMPKKADRHYCLSIASKIPAGSINELFDNADKVRVWLGEGR